MHWQSASIPVRAVTSGGTPTPSSASITAARGSIPSLRKLALNLFSGTLTTAFRVASAPVPAVHGTAIQGVAGFSIFFPNPTTSR